MAEVIQMPGTESSAPAYDTVPEVLAKVAAQEHVSIVVIGLRDGGVMDLYHTVMADTELVYFLEKIKLRILTESHEWDS